VAMAGILFSTAVKQGCDITHYIWNDGKYNMVKSQEVDKYRRSAGNDLDGVDFVKYAEAFGARDSGSWTRERWKP
jgi:thiamine pyrophosphate-dependent acetolactate synthase large subunit-like protein